MTQKIKLQFTNLSWGRILNKLNKKTTSKVYGIFNFKEFSAKILLIILLVFSTCTSSLFASPVDDALAWLRLKAAEDRFNVTYNLDPDTFLDMSLGTEAFSRYIDLDDPLFLRSLDYIDHVHSFNLEHTAISSSIVGNFSASISSRLEFLKNSIILDSSIGLYSWHYGTDFLATLWALRAFSDNKQYVHITYILDEIKSRQNQDGSWGLLYGEDGSVIITSFVLLATAQYKGISAYTSMIDNGVQWLMSKRTVTGTYGDNPNAADVFETALAYRAVEESKGISTRDSLTENWLLSNQLPDGSFGGSIKSTAAVLLALSSGRPQINIASADITFSNSNPILGEDVIITAKVTNKGLTDALMVKVRFFDGNPYQSGTQIGEEQVIDLLTAGGAGENVSTTFTMAGPVGQHDIHVFVDPFNEITELNENDNHAATVLRILPGIDLSVVENSLKTDPSYVIPDTPVTFEATIVNLGAETLITVETTFYDGNPENTGTQSIPPVNWWFDVS